MTYIYLSDNSTELEEKRTLSGWLTNRYLLIIRNEENFAEKRTLTFNYARLFLVLILGFLLSLALAVFLVTSVLEQWLDPRHAQMVANRQVLQLTMAIDSLEIELSSRDRYIYNIKAILDGQPPEESDNRSIEGATPVVESVITEELSPVDSQFRANYENSDLGLVALSRSGDDELREMFLFVPVNGLITGGFDPKVEHFGVDIVSKENEPIKAVADGVVVFSSWTLDGGYVLGIQHRGNLISVYKHNSELIKNVGSFVTSGEIVAIIGNTGELTSGPHLHLELWHQGRPVNPEDYILF